MKKVILLSRVSTQVQDLVQQTEKLMQAASFLGYSEEDCLIIEDKESAVKLTEEERNGLTKLKDSIITNPAIKDVIVYELSRIARTPKVLYSIRDFLIEHRVQLHVLNPSFKLLKEDGTIDESANLIFSLFTSMSENEGYIRKQRLARGKEKAAKEHRFFGGKLPYGYSTDKNHNFIINEDEAEIVKKIFTLFRRKSVQDIALDLVQDGTFDLTYNAACTMVRHILRRTRYCGKETAFNGYVENQHAFKYPAIVSVEDVEFAQNKLGHRANRAKSRSKHDYLCRGIVVDINDDILIPMYTHNTYTKNYYYKNGSSSLSINIPSIDMIAWYFTMNCKEHLPKYDIGKYEKDIKDELASIDKKLKNINSKIEKTKAKNFKIEERLIAGKITDEMADELHEQVSREIEVQNRDVAGLEARREDLNARLINLTSQESSHLLGHYSQLTIKEKAELVRAVIDKIVVVKTGHSTYSLGVVFKFGDYCLCTFNPYNKTLVDEQGQMIDYQNEKPSQPNC